jgi:hypothetical protein
MCPNGTQLIGWPARRQAGLAKSLNPEKPVFRWGAHAPRVPFSTPSWKTLSAQDCFQLSAKDARQKTGREARPATPGAGCAPPKISVSGLNRNFGLIFSNLPNAGFPPPANFFELK